MLKMVCILGIALGCGKDVIGEFRPVGLELTGAILDTDGEPIAAAQLVARGNRDCGQGGEFTTTRTTDAAGRFNATLISISGIPGCLVLVGSANGFLPDTMRITDAPFRASPNYESLDVTLRMRRP